MYCRNTSDYSTKLYNRSIGGTDKKFTLSPSWDLVCSYLFKVRTFNLWLQGQWVWVPTPGTGSTGKITGTGRSYLYWVDFSCTPFQKADIRRLRNVCGIGGGVAIGTGGGFWIESAQASVAWKAASRIYQSRAALVWWSWQLAGIRNK